MSATATEKKDTFPYPRNGNPLTALYMHKLLKRSQPDMSIKRNVTEMIIAYFTDFWNDIVPLNDSEMQSYLADRLPENIAGYAIKTYNGDYAADGFLPRNKYMLLYMLINELMLDVAVVTQSRGTPKHRRRTIDILDLNTTIIRDPEWYEYLRDYIILFPYNGFNCPHCVTAKDLGKLDFPVRSGDTFRTGLLHVARSIAVYYQSQVNIDTNFLAFAQAVGATSLHDLQLVVGQQLITMANQVRVNHGGKEKTIDFNHLLFAINAYYADENLGPLMRHIMQTGFDYGNNLYEHSEKNDKP